MGFDGWGGFMALMAVAAIFGGEEIRQPITITEDQKEKFISVLEREKIKMQNEIDLLKQNPFYLADNEKLKEILNFKQKMIDTSTQNIEMLKKEKELPYYTYTALCAMCELPNENN